MSLLSICDNSSVLGVMLIIKKIIMIISIVVPIILILSLMITIVKALMSKDDDLLAKIKVSAVRKMVASVIVFLIPTFVNVLVKLTPNNIEYKKCLSDAEYDLIVQRRSEEEAMQKINDEKLAAYNKKLAEESAKKEQERLNNSGGGNSGGGSSGGNSGDDSGGNSDGENTGGDSDGDSGGGSNYASSGSYTTWKQCDSRWGSNKMGASQTICGAGCTSTSVAIALAKSGVSNSLSTLNPGTFVNWMNNNGGYIGSNGGPGNLLVWGAVTSLAPSFKYKGYTSLSGSDSQKIQVLKNALNNGEYIIASVNNGGHWVFVDYIEGNNVYIIDPGRNVTNLFYYTGVSGYASYKVS